MIFLIAFGRFLTNSFYRDLHIEVIVRALPNENKAEEIPGLATVQPVAPVRPTEHGLTRGQIYNFCAQIASTTQSSENDTGWSQIDKKSFSNVIASIFDKRNWSNGVFL